MPVRISGCIYRHRDTHKSRRCSNPLRADGNRWVSCPYDGRLCPGTCVFWDDGAQTAAEEVA